VLWRIEAPTSPTPLSSLFFSLVTLVVLAGLYWGFQALRSRREKRSLSFFDKLIEWTLYADRVFVVLGSLGIGTYYERAWVRRSVLVTVLVGLALAGAIVPWPWALFCLALGVLGILVVFRHWLRDEYQSALGLMPHEKDIPIHGNLHPEVIVACGFLLVFAPIAFAQLQVNGFGFEVSADAGPGTFFVYTIIETLKAGSLVSYYDLFADELGFNRIAHVDNPTATAKWAVLGYRASLNLLMLAVLKRMIDIIRRRREGLDLRQIEGLLNTPDEASHQNAIAQLKLLASAGRSGATVLLGRIIHPSRWDKWRFSKEVKLAAVDAMRDSTFNETIYGNPVYWGATYASVAGYKQLLKDHQDARTGQPIWWGRVHARLAKQLQEIAGHQESTALMQEAAESCRVALKVMTNKATLESFDYRDIDIDENEEYGGEGETFDEYLSEVADTYQIYGEVLEKLSSRTNERKQLEDAASAYQLSIKWRKRVPEELDGYMRDAWDFDSEAQGMHYRDLGETAEKAGAVLVRLSESEANSVLLGKAAGAYRSAIEWFSSAKDLLPTYEVIKSSQAEEARLRGMTHTFNGSFSSKPALDCLHSEARCRYELGRVLVTISERENGAGALREAVLTFEQALEMKEDELGNEVWLGAPTADVHLTLARTLVQLGRAEGNNARFEAALEPYRTALEIERWYEPGPFKEFGELLLEVGKQKNEVALVEEASETFIAGIESLTYAGILQEDDLTDYIQYQDEKARAAWGAMQHGLAQSLKALGELKHDVAKFDEALNAIAVAVTLEPDNNAFRRTEDEIHILLGEATKDETAKASEAAPLA
jgi:tetratricopeptide (TPR) repeat protein